MTDLKKDMSREQQTKCIVGAIMGLAAVVGVFTVDYLRTHDETTRWAACASIFQTDKLKCQADISAARLHGY